MRLHSRNYIMLLLCVLLISCYSKEVRLKKQIKTWNERTKPVLSTWLFYGNKKAGNSCV